MKPKGYVIFKLYSNKWIKSKSFKRFNTGKTKKNLTQDTSNADAEPLRRRVLRVARRREAPARHQTLARRVPARPRDEGRQFRAELVAAPRLAREMLSQQVAPVREHQELGVAGLLRRAADRGARDARLRGFDDDGIGVGDALLNPGAASHIKQIYSGAAFSS